MTVCPRLILASSKDCSKYQTIPSRRAEGVSTCASQIPLCPPAFSCLSTAFTQGKRVPLQQPLIFNRKLHKYACASLSAWRPCCEMERRVNSRLHCVCAIRVISTVTAVVCPIIHIFRGTPWRSSLAVDHENTPFRYLQNFAAH